MNDRDLIRPSKRRVVRVMVQEGWTQIGGLEVNLGDLKRYWIEGTKVTLQYYSNPSLQEVRASKKQREHFEQSIPKCNSTVELGVGDLFVKNG